MWPDRVSNQGPLAYESDVLPTGLHGLAHFRSKGNRRQSYKTMLPHGLIRIGGHHLCSSAPPDQKCRHFG